jgi:hypothetical protein
LIGFCAILLAASFGTFVATDMTRLFIHDPAALQAWNMTLKQSAHGHTNLFGMLHIVFGLTMSYSPFSVRIKSWQTAGILSGTLAMSIGMLLRASQGPVEGFDVTGGVLGFMFSATFVALGVHVLGLIFKLVR